MSSKYNQIGIGYNETRKADEYLVDRLFYHLQPSSNNLYLDIGCGSGNYTNALSQKGTKFIGVDPSEHMLQLAQMKNDSIIWLKGKAEAIPLINNQIDGVMGSLTMHHWDSLKEGFKELNRVLKTNGRIVLFTSTPQQMKGYWLNHYFPKMLSDSMIQMPTYESIAEAMLQNGFQILTTEKYDILPTLNDLFLYAGKQNPQMYLDPSIRKGISSFSALANREEVEMGLKKLEEDIASQKIDTIIKSYENNGGDYLYIIGQKIG